MKHNDFRKLERDFWGDLALSQAPEFMLTVTMKRFYSDRVTTDAFRFAMRAIQRKIPSKRVLRGVGTLERTWKNAAFENQLHLHALLWGVVENVPEPKAYMSNLVDTVFMKLRDTQGRPMTRRKNIHLKYIDEPNGASIYTMKDVGKFPLRRSRVWLITPKGFDTTTDNFN